MEDKKEITTHGQCYSCVHIGRVPGSAHSSCNLFKEKQDFEPPKANINGVRNGWYMFPYNYDPVWQEELCKGFEQK